MNQDLQSALSTLTRMGLQPKEAGGQWLAYCPIHESDGQGHKPSLNLKVGDKVPLVVNCHAGCDRKEILKVLGVNGTPRSDKRRIVATHPYRDASGATVFEKLRYEPKDFRIRHCPGPGADWVWKKPELSEYPLYRQSELRAAIEAGETVWVCEGEKDVDRLTALGFVATTNFEGAAKGSQKAKWRPEYTRKFSGAACIILLPDNDEPGRARCAAIGAALRAADREAEVLTVNLPGLPYKGDVSDWLNAGHTADDLRELAARAEPEGYLPTSDNPVDSPEPDKRRFMWIQDFCALPAAEHWVVQGYLERDALAVVYGDSEAFKSFIAIDLCAHVATGRPWRGARVRQGITAFIAGEGGNGLRKRFKAWFQHHDEPLRNVVISTVPLALCDPINVQALVEDTVAFLGAVRPALIVLDTLNAHFGGGDENSTKDMSLFLAGMRALRVATGATILALHHCGHGAKDRGRGSISLRNGIDWEYRAERQPESLTTTLTCTKSKDSDRPKPLAWELETVALPWVDDEGNPLSSAILRPLDAVPVRDEPLSSQQRQALELLKGLHQTAQDNLTAGGLGPAGARVTMGDWQEAMKNMPTSKEVRSRIRKALIDRKAVHFDQGFVDPKG